MEARICQTCGTEFRTNNKSEQCYTCHLHRITGGMAPEEGDFNSAHLAAGDWDEAQMTRFRLSLQRVELGMSEEDSFDDEPMLDLDPLDLFEEGVLDEEDNFFDAARYLRHLS